MEVRKMKKILMLALLVSGVVLAGMVSANMTRTDAARGERLWSTPNVRASVIYKSGDTVSIYSPDGNIALCVGDNIPIFRAENPKANSPVWFTTNFTSPPDLLDKKLIGEVRIIKHFGDNYAFGKLVVGDANEGDLAAKPSKSCLAS